MLLPSPFRKLWLGQQSLPMAFWFYGFFLYCVLFFACELVLFPLLPRGVAAGVSTVIMWPYMILTWVGIWRSANAYAGKRDWALAAKTVVGCAVVWYAAGFFRQGGFNHLFGLLMGSN